MLSLELKDNDFIPLCDLLKRVGLCESGGHAKSVIAAGEVQVNGVVELRKRCKIIVGQEVTYNNEKVVVC
jgi:ribosome-associated protein